MIQQIGEHSVDVDLLKPNSMVLDAGCRGFEFTNELRKLGHRVLPVDIDDLDAPYLYAKVAVGLMDGKCSINKTTDPQATHTKAGNDIDMYTIESLYNRLFMEKGKFDLIKLDIEGDEYEILKQSKHPLATQVSVEFHAHCGKQTKEQLDELLVYLSQFYTIHNQIWESRHGAGFNYWDVLLIKK